MSALGQKRTELKYELGTDPRTGRRVTKYVSFKGSKREAQAELVRLMDTVRRGEHVDPTKLTVAEFLDRWEQGWAALQVGPATRERYSYSGLLRLHIRPHIGASLLHKLQPLHLAELYAKMLERGLSASTIHDVHQVLHKALIVAGMVTTVTQSRGHCKAASGAGSRNRDRYHRTGPEYFAMFAWSRSLPDCRACARHGDAARRTTGIALGRCRSECRSNSGRALA